ncbi:type II toxin-antitoxin system RelE family toxin [Methanoplanus endosymbiosus]|uniref:type II toxin-antitoxin system RelE family toxin n=1 Tax=Methanoplanus endosymbiosus TaxID=33865 RepID=UPI003564D5F2
MIPYSIGYKDGIKRDLNKISKIYYDSIFSRIGKLSIEPIPSDSVKIAGSDNYYRIRSGDYRIIYTVIHEQNSVIIYYIRHRKNIYRDF